MAQSPIATFARLLPWFSVGVALFLPLAAAGGDELVVGSKAPALDIEHWIQKPARRGAEFVPVTEFEPGRIFVIEFWATWCPPCRKSMPHLADLQRTFADKDVTVISVTDEDLETVTSFLDTKASDDRTYREITNGYLLSADPDGSVSRDYMKASGQQGIPTAFIVGRTGEIEWIGHPMEMDDPLAGVVAGTFDRAAGVAAAGEMKALQGRIPQIARLLEEEKTAAAVDLLDTWLADARSPAAREWLTRFRRALAMKTGGSRAVEAFEESAAEAADSADGLNELAWGIEQAAARGGDVSVDLLAAAVRAVERGLELEPDRGDLLDTLAHLLARQARFEEALVTQRRAVEHATAPLLGPISSYLEELEILADLRRGDAVAITADEACRHVGELCRVTMDVTGGRLLNTARCFLNSKRDRLDEDNFTAVILGPGMRRFERAGIDDPFEHFTGRAVRVTGVISLHKDRPQIVVEVPGQIELLPEGVTPESPDPELDR